MLTKQLTHKPNRSQQQTGFTLLELMITLLVASVLVGLAIPSFQQTLARNQLAVQVNSFLAALTYARSEAIKRGVPVSVLARNPTDPANEWANGWCVTTGNPATTDCTAAAVIEQYDGLTNNDLLHSPNNETFVQFNSRGGLPVGTNLNIDLCPEEPIVGSRRIQLGFTGRASVYKADDPDPARQPSCPAP